MKPLGNNILLLCAISFSMKVFGASVPSGKEYAFIEMDSGGPVAVLSEHDSRFIFAEEATEATFCPPQSEFYCINTKYFEFYVPKKIGKQLTWRHGQEIYCVLQNYEDLPSVPDRLLLIHSQNGGSCEDATPSDGSFVYSPTIGLRAVTIRNKKIAFHLFSLDRLGFGAARDTDTKGK